MARIWLKVVQQKHPGTQKEVCSQSSSREICAANQEGQSQISQKAKSLNGRRRGLWMHQPRWLVSQSNRSRATCSDIMKLLFASDGHTRVVGFELFTFRRRLGAHVEEQKLFRFATNAEAKTCYSFDRLQQRRHP